LARRVLRPGEPSGAAPVPPSLVGRALPQLAIHAERHRQALGGDDLTPFELRVFSQNGEDGVIGEIFSRIGTTNRTFVEFGIGTGREGNCVLLADVYGWSGAFIEADPDFHRSLEAKYQPNPRVATRCAFVTADNVEATFTDLRIPVDLDLLSIDIDGSDYWVWRALTSFRPRVLVIEYNSTLPVDRALVWPPDRTERWDGTAHFGSSILALTRLGKEKGYRLVHTDLCGVNAFFVRDDVAELVGVTDPPLRSMNIGLVGIELPAAPEGRTWLDLDNPGAGTSTP
jgi:hypothetical protein